MLATGMFRPDEIDIAAEVLDDALAKGPSGHYQSCTAELSGRAVGWVCFGPTPCTVGTYDIYWIAVCRTVQGKGIGKALMAHSERSIGQFGGRLAVVETNGREQYEPTRQFYLRCGYGIAARVKDFYSVGDDKVIFTKGM
jgi:GNAT superfamily N-acetyltransferase